MNAEVEPALRGRTDRLADDYERLRNNRLAEPGCRKDGDGMVLLMRKGLVVWMRTRITAAVATAVDGGPRDPSDVSFGSTPSEEVTAVLTTMAYSALMGGGLQ